MKTRILTFFILLAIASGTALASITYELNGGVTNDYGWLNKNDMFQACMADCGVTDLSTLDELQVAGDASFSTICNKLTDVSGMLSNSKWDWLEAYIMSVQNADATATALVEGTPSAGWRYAVAAFFLESQRTSWPKSADFSAAGKVEAFIPAWKHGFANPTNPTTTFVLNAPYKEGDSFLGWYWNADFSGGKVTTINAESNGTLYAKFGEYIPTIAEVKAMTSNTQTQVSGVVTFIQNRYAFIQDATGGLMLFMSATPTFAVGEQVVVSGLISANGGAPQLKMGTEVSAEPSTMPEPIVFENMTPLVQDTQLKYFGQLVSVPGLIIESYSNSGYPTVSDGINSIECSNMVLDQTAFPIGTKITITAVASWYNGFQFRGDISGIEIVTAGKKESYTYPTRNEKYSLENNWVISVTEDNYAENKPGTTGNVRGMAAEDGIMYFINRETASITRVDGATGNMLEPIKITGEHLFEVEQEDGTFASGVTMPFNDIKFDNAGNCLIGACITGPTQYFMVYKVDLSTGATTLIVNDRLADNPEYADITCRFDAFGVAGDVTKNGVIMAADASGSWNVYRWLIQDGIADGGEQIAIELDPDVDQSLFIDAAGFGTAPQIAPQDEYGSIFYVDGYNTLPMLFEEGGTLLDDFIKVPTGTTVQNNEGETTTLHAGLNGLQEFQVGNEYFLVMAATMTNSNPPSAFALYKFADEARTFDGLEPLWYFPHNGLGSVSNGCRTAIPSVEVNGNTATISIYAVDNGYASYTLTIGDLPTPNTITYELNGGITNDYGWMNKGDMFAACITDALGYDLGMTLDEFKRSNTPFDDLFVFFNGDHCQNILDNARWDWLEEYLIKVQKEDQLAATLTAGVASQDWRYAIAAFFFESQYDTSSDYSQAGKDEAYIPYWKHGYDNPTQTTKEFTLNAPYKENHIFEGWYATPDFSSAVVTTINASTSGTLYAKWKIAVVVENATVTIDTIPLFGDTVDYALKMTADWTYAEDGVTYPILVEVPVYYPDAIEPYYTLSTVTIGGLGDNDPWLGFGEGELTITTVDDVVIVAGIVENQQVGIVIDITISGKLPTTEVPCEDIFTIETITACDSYDWNGQTYTQSGDYTYTTVAANGCDSIVTLHLTINQSVIAPTEYITICYGETYTWNGQTYSTEGEYSIVLSNINGCDSIVTLHLTISQTLTAEETITACDSYEWNGQTYTQSGDYTYTTVAANGCDSIVTLHLTITQSIVAPTEYATICHGETYTWNGQTYSTKGEYSITFSNTNGCDSTATLHLTVLPEVQASEESVTICYGEQYEWNGKTYTTTGEYSMTLSDVNGCDSIPVLHLTVMPQPMTKIQSVTISNDQIPYVWNDNEYTETGQYTVPEKYTNIDCDSVLHVLDLTVLTTDNYDEENVTICDSELPFQWRGQSYTQSGKYSYAEKYVGTTIDSIQHILNLSVVPTHNINEYISICHGETYSWNNQIYSTGGEYSITLSNIYGCDSIVTLHLTVLPEVIPSEESATICYGETYTWNGQTYSTEGEYSITLSNTNGCDSVATLHLTVLPEVQASEESVTICYGETYEWNGQIYTATGTYSINLSNINGCDSIVTLHLTILPEAIIMEESASINEEHLPYLWRGQQCYDSGTYNDSEPFTNYPYCDSVIYVLNLTVDRSNKCGEHLYWKYDNNTLFITGSGAMYDAPDLLTYRQEGSFFPYRVRNIVLPDGITHIGNVAFADCANLTHIDIPNSVTSIGDGAFSWTGLQSVIIPASVTNLGEQVFETCNNLHTILYEGAPSSINNQTVHPFIGCVHLDTIITPAALWHCTTADPMLEARYGVPHKARYIEVTNGELTKQAMKYIAKNSGTVEVLDLSAATNTTLPLGALLNNYRLSTLYLPEQIEVIPEMLAEGCYSLTEILIPATVTEIGNYAFAGCTNVWRMTVDAVLPPKVYDKTFDGIDRSISLIVPAGSEELYRQAAYWQEFFIDDTHSQSPKSNCQKILHEDHILILREGKVYTTMGQLVK